MAEVYGGFLNRRVDRRKGLAEAAKGVVALTGAVIIGRGALETGQDVYKAGKEAVETTRRAYRQIAFWAHKSPGAVRAVEGGVLIESLKTKTKTEFSAVFHFKESERTKIKEARNLVREMHGVIGVNKSYINGELFDVVNKYEAKIEKNAAEFGIDPRLAIGVAFVENGGGEAQMNDDSGALGVAQLMPDTAKRYGLKMDGKVDERADPVKSILVMCNYLRDLNNEFLDPGLAIWGYHAGEGNVYEALRIYFRDTDKKDYGDPIEGTNAPGNAETYRRLIKERNLTVHDVLQNSQVRQEFLLTLKDESELYPYKVIAASQLYRIEKEMI